MRKSSHYKQGLYKPKNPKKYKGDIKKICYRSSLELTFMKYCDSNNNVISWSSEEFFIPYLDPTSESIRRYFPDFLIEFKQKNGIKKYLIEVKPFRQTKKPTRGKKKPQTYLKETLEYNKNISKWQYAQQWCKKHNVEFKIITEKDLGVYK